MKQEKMKEFAVTNLTYCRLKASLAAVEMEIAGNQPIVSEAEENFFKNAWNRFRVGVKNEIRKKTLEDLTKELASAEAELVRFEGAHTAKELSLSSDLTAFKSFLINKLFKKDASGMDKLRFALSLLMDKRYTYYRPEHSLCNNFKYICNEWTISIDDLLSLIPSFGNVSVQTWINKSKQRKFTSRVEKLTADQAATLFAMKLTIVEKSKSLLPKEEWETLIDDTLKFIQDFRADAECEKVFTEQEDGVFEKIFSLCARAVNRLAEIAKN